MGYWLTGVGVCLSLMGGQAWADAGTGRSEGGAAIVAAGFGYQNDAESTITVKVYNAASGEVLSEDVYELSIKEDRSVRSDVPEARIFAGGVGLGATDLSNFVLRVYDAKTGEFQWAGQLNLTADGGNEMGHMISTVVPRRAVVTKIHDVTETDAPYPLFLLRAWDASTGGLIWEDEFSTDGKGAALARQIASGKTGFDGVALGIDTIDFRILMFDHSSRAVLWEDQVFQRPTDEEGQGAVDDRAQKLPTWTEPIEQESTPEEI
jgi:hypothetical protein